LIALGRGEHSIYQIVNELRDTFPDLPVQGVIGDVGDSAKMDHIFRIFQPALVFHAAAYKHVAFVEENPEEGVRNNTFGTRNIALTSLRHQVERFMLISTDKAVYPSSVLGATKKLAELIVAELAGRGTTGFITVRFGNVLRSRGSAVPLFEQQIARGGPVTVTHPDMTRFFMSIPEAAQLVLRSGEVAANGDLCVLDMGAPVRILDLVETLIALHGHAPHRDIGIEFTGIKPGEKLTEQMLTEEEARETKRTGKLLISQSGREQTPLEEDQLERLRAAAVACRRDEVIELLEAIVPNYRAPRDKVGTGRT
jgi:FlaA1/EpsC-like NDP-sugar epimerase